MADDLIRKSDVLETYADLYDIFDDNKIIQEELHKVFDKINNIPAVESSSSEKTNACDTCRFELYCPEMCEGCCEWDSHYEPKDEPTISKMEQVEKPQTEIGYQDCADALLKMWMDNILTDAEFNRIIDRLNKDRDKIKCPKCGRSDYIKSFKDWGIDGGIYKYKCINCNTYIKGEVRDE